MWDYNGTEKIRDLPHKLSTHGAPDGFAPSAGDLTFYAPWGNRAVFYRDSLWSGSLVSLGRMLAGVENWLLCEIIVQLPLSRRSKILLHAVSKKYGNGGAGT